MTIKIAVVTGSRADFGLLLPVMKRLQKSKILTMEVIATGSHLSIEHENSVEEIWENGIEPGFIIPVDPESDSGVEHALALGQALPEIAGALSKIEPAAILLLGDRTEILVSAFAGLLLNIPIAHVNGGELTFGAMDEAIRHSISKMSAVHFVSHDIHRIRLLQMGELPESIVLAGSLGYENAAITRPGDEWETFQLRTGISEAGPLMLVTYHPETLNLDASYRDLKQLLTALEAFDHWTILFTGSNNDVGSAQVRDAINHFVSEANNRVFIPSLGVRTYLAVLRRADVVVGNSSSGLIEAPAVQTPTVNIGKRQLGRFSPPSIYHATGCSSEISAQISRAIHHTWSKRDTEEGYVLGEQLPSEIIVSSLEERVQSLTASKAFRDIEV